MNKITIQQNKTVVPELCVAAWLISPFECDAAGQALPPCPTRRRTQDALKKQSPSWPGNNLENDLEVPLEELQDGLDFVPRGQTKRAKMNAAL